MIFISHRKSDEISAKHMAAYLHSKNVITYLDLLDPTAKSASDITTHIMNNLNKCSHLIVIFSKNTQGSMWVPFELGAAYKSGKGIGTYLTDNVLTPEYLNAFPRMRTSMDVDRFVDEYREDQRIQKSARYTSDGATNLSESSRPLNAERFITRLKSRLGQ